MSVQLSLEQATTVTLDITLRNITAALRTERLITVVLLYSLDKGLEACRNGDGFGIRSSLVYYCLASYSKQTLDVGALRKETLSYVEKLTNVQFRKLKSTSLAALLPSRHMSTLG